MTKDEARHLIAAGLIYAHGENKDGLRDLFENFKMRDWHFEDWIMVVGESIAIAAGLAVSVAKLSDVPVDSFLSAFAAAVQG